jgi:hypothetical protein
MIGGVILYLLVLLFERYQSIKPQHVRSVAHPYDAGVVGLTCCVPTKKVASACWLKRAVRVV